MQTPRKVIDLSQTLLIQPQRKYTEEEKQQLLMNLELEVQDRIRQFETYLEHSLEAFKLRHENEVTRIPRAVRGLTIGEFADKYDGDINKALQAITRARLDASEDFSILDDTARKRKWDAFTTNDQTETAEQTRQLKNARLNPNSPVKKVVGGGARPKLAKTPVSRPRQVPPSPRIGTGFRSPYKPLPNEISHSPIPKARVPSLSHFNPILPRTPAYPPETAPDSGQGQGRLHRQRSITILRGPTLAHPGSRKGAKTLEMILSLKVYMDSGDILELDPLSTTVEDLDTLEGITEEARKSAKTELLELTGLMEKLGRWRI